MTTESGLFLYQVNSYIQYARPTNFEATWMLVAYWVGVHPYFGASNPEVSIYNLLSQHVLIHSLI